MSWLSSRRTPTWMLVLGGATLGMALAALALRYRRYVLGLDTDPTVATSAGDSDAGTGIALAARVRLIDWNDFQTKMDERTNFYVSRSKHDSDAAETTGDLADVIRMYTTAPFSTGDWMSAHQGILLPGQATVLGGDQPVDAKVFQETRKAQRALLKRAGVLECVDRMHLRLPYPRVWNADDRSSTPMDVYRRARTITKACPPQERAPTSGS